MKVVIVEKIPFATKTFNNVTSISYNSSTDVITINNGTEYQFHLSDIKIMIV